MRTSYRILLADDDADDRYLMHQAFEAIGWREEVKLFDSGRQLINYLDSLNGSGYPGLIVLNDNMPGMNAPEILLHLKRYEKYNHIAVAVYSNSLTVTSREKLLAMGITACYEKTSFRSNSIELAKIFRQLADDTIAAA